MRHLPIVTLLVAAACGGTAAKPSPATTPAPATTTVAPAAEPAKTVVDGVTLADNERFGELLSVEAEDEELCFVTVHVLGRDGGSIYESDPALCAEDHEADIGTNVVIVLDSDQDIIHMIPFDEYQRQSGQ